jgi:hypothetical protein
MVELIVDTFVFRDRSELITCMSHAGNGGLIIGIEPDTLSLVILMGARVLITKTYHGTNYGV